MFFKIIIIFLMFLLLSGMRIIFKDGNYIDVDNYYFYKDKVVIKIHDKVFEINEILVDKDNTLKLNYLEQKKISILKAYTSFKIEPVDKREFLFKKEQSNLKNSNIKDTKIKLETRKEKTPFFSDENIKDENVLEKIQRKGIMIKIQVPVLEEKN
ncbi:MAG: hypothetical protein N2202_00855 [Proteobacteria bacterium]|nr:hypothetical protein [Pseudomonadota bacterium]